MKKTLIKTLVKKQWPPKKGDCSACGGKGYSTQLVIPNQDYPLGKNRKNPCSKCKGTGRAAKFKFKAEREYCPICKQIFSLGHKLNKHNNKKHE